MKSIRILVLALLAVSAFGFGVVQAMEHPKKTERPTQTEHPAKAEHPDEAAAMAGAGDLVTIAGGAGDLTTFVAAVKAAGLIEKFQGKGPFTVFAPSDKAFAALPKGTVEDLLKPANQAKLAGILANHVVPGKIMAADVKTMKATNVGGQDLDIEVAGGGVTVGGAKVIKADLAASNGVIHVIDKVLLPTAAAEHPATDKPKDHPDH
jgi:uncharacterized surface protein with fasciclin (FAS1) repeats